MIVDWTILGSVAAVSGVLVGLAALGKIERDKKWEYRAFLILLQMELEWMEGQLEQDGAQRPVRLPAAELLVERGHLVRMPTLLRDRLLFFRTLLREAADLQGAFESAVLWVAASGRPPVPKMQEAINEVTEHRARILKILRMKSPQYREECLTPELRKLKVRPGKSDDGFWSGIDLGSEDTASHS